MLVLNGASSTHIIQEKVWTGPIYDSIDLLTRQSFSACMHACNGVASAYLLVRGINWRRRHDICVLA
jgi:hypothetical protein